MGLFKRPENIRKGIALTLFEANSGLPKKFFLGQGVGFYASYYKKRSENNHSY
ncbi:hypothetical protein MYAER_4052 [Microcystis aeruginosa NIES-2549]|uniref:Uncharacterized protein n=1 Tax=Microcystis aeruginosa NIES-2549 TaxID=1641812 RepID=A0A0F6RNR2_MICAE|nr:hypothetical protein MYAER_4052 [Microcystis aeruginosa NIES-2549]AOC54785.1 hypothetical protein amyaer_4098 [Microcystis aeruginosa NIES-2481]